MRRYIHMLLEVQKHGHTSASRWWLPLGTMEMGFEKGTKEQKTVFAA